MLGSLAEAIKAQSEVPEEWDRLKEIFSDKNLQMISFTITEKGYALKGVDGNYFPFIQKDIDNGPEKPVSDNGGCLRIAVRAFSGRKGSSCSSFHG